MSVKDILEAVFRKNLDRVGEETEREFEAILKRKRKLKFVGGGQEIEFELSGTNVKITFSGKSNFTRVGDFSDAFGYLNQGISNLGKKRDRVFQDLERSGISK